MCAVSRVVDYMATRIPVADWKRPEYDLLMEILDKLNKLDERLGQPDCLDPEKAKYLQQIRDSLTSPSDLPKQEPSHWPITTIQTGGTTGSPLPPITQIIS